MTCEECRERFTDLVENGLSPELDAELREHLDACKDCRQMLVDFWAVVEAVRGLPIVEPPAALRDRVRRAVQESAAERARFTVVRRLRYTVAGVAAAAAAFVLVWAGVAHWGRGGETAIELPPRPAVEEGVGEAPAADRAVPGTERGVPPGKTVPGEAAVEGEGAEAPVVAAGTGGAPVAETGAVAPAEPGTGRVAPAGERPARGVRAPVSEAAGPEEALAPPAGGRGTGGFAPVTREGRGWTWGGGGGRAGEITEGEPTSLAPPVGTRTYMGQRAGPTSADLQVLPPAERIVGEPATATVAITPARAVAAATVSVSGSSGLEVLGAERGVIYRGSLAGGERTDLSVRIIARRAGTHQLTVNVKSSDGALSTGVVARIPGFALPAPAEQRRVKLSFTGTPVREAIQKIAAASGLRVVVREEVGTETVTKDFSAGVPAQAALVIVAEACGYRVREDNGSYVVEKP